MLIREETPGDIAAIHEVNVLAFGRENEADLVDALRASDDFLSALSLVALEGPKVVGHILFTPVQIHPPERRDARKTPARQGVYPADPSHDAPEAAPEPVPVLALAPMAVLPDHQRQGIGSGLLRFGLGLARTFGYGIVIVVGHPEYYPRFGFEPARARGIESPFPVPDAAFMALELFPGALHGARGTVSYSAPFSTIF